MILFFRTPTNSVIATECSKELNSEDIKKLCWLYSDATVEVDYYFITDYMQSYLHDYNSGTYIEIEGEMPYDTNAQIMWDKEAEIEAETEAKSRTTMENDNGEYTCDLEYGEHKLHLIATLLNASEGQLEKGIGYLFGIREIAEKIPGFLPDIQ